MSDADKDDLKTDPPGKDWPRGGESMDEGPRRSISDQPTDDDSVGFKPYLQALAEFLTNPETEPPLTLSIEGEWGSGKSSFMQQLAKEVERRTRGEDNEGWKELVFGKPTRVIWFNAWRHDKVDSLYSGFAIHFLEAIRKGTPWLRRVRGSWLLWKKRFEWKDGGILVFARVILLWMFFLSSAFYVSFHGVPAFYHMLDIGESRISRAHQNEQEPKPQKGTGKETTPEGISGPLASVTGYLLLLLLAFERIAKLSDPIRLEVRKRILAPDYEKRLGLVEQFHKDFKRVIDAYLIDLTPAPDRPSAARVFVFIDDLDRCEIPRAADLMQGLNLLISDSPQIVFILGIDRQKIAAALAVKYQQFLPYFPVSRRLRREGGKAEPKNGQGDLQKDEGEPLNEQADRQKYKAEPLSGKAHEFDPRPGLEFGYSFLEKFIQLAFQIPRMTSGELQKFLESLDVAGPKPQSKSDEDPGSAPPRVAKDTVEVLEIARVVSSSLEFNPRRLKQFLNIFRLQRFIAFHTKRLKPSVSVPGEGATIQQLGKFVAILLRLPAILPDLLIFPTLLAELEKAALNPSSSDYSPIWVDDYDGLKQPKFEDWRDRSALRKLLQAGPEAKTPQSPGVYPPIYVPPEWSLASFDVASFLSVSPMVVPIAQRFKHRGEGEAEKKSRTTGVNRHKKGPPTVSS